MHFEGLSSESKVLTTNLMALLMITNENKIDKNQSFLTNYHVIKTEFQREMLDSSEIPENIHDYLEEYNEFIENIIEYYTISENDAVNNILRKKLRGKDENSLTSEEVKEIKAEISLLSEVKMDICETIVDSLMEDYLRNNNTPEDYEAIIAILLTSCYKVINEEDDDIINEMQVKIIDQIATELYIGPITLEYIVENTADFFELEEKIEESKEELNSLKNLYKYASRNEEHIEEAFKFKKQIEQCEEEISSLETEFEAVAITLANLTMKKWLNEEFNLA